MSLDPRPVFVPVPLVAGPLLSARTSPPQDSYCCSRSPTPCCRDGMMATRPPPCCLLPARPSSSLCSSPSCWSRKRPPSPTMVARTFPDLDPPSPPAGTAFTARIRRCLDLPPRISATTVRRCRAETRCRLHRLLAAVLLHAAPPSRSSLTNCSCCSGQRSCALDRPIYLQARPWAAFPCRPAPRLWPAWAISPPTARFGPW